MKKIFNWMLAAIITCGASVFTSCGNVDDPASPAEPDLGVAEKIIGRWLAADIDGQGAPTNKKGVITFVSDTKAYQSASFSEIIGMPWVNYLETDVVIIGNKMNLTSHPDEHTTVAEEYTVTAINSSEFTANHKVTITKDGNVVFTDEHVLRFVKQNADYSADILGMWEGRMTSEQSVYGDVEDHRWEYMTDGTFNFFRKVDGQWQISDDEYADYFVAGNLLCTRWKNAGEGNEEHREWWEIESIEDGVMKWKALRQKEDGSTYTATFEMKKVTE